METLVVKGQDIEVDAELHLEECGRTCSCADADHEFSTAPSTVAEDAVTFEDVQMPSQAGTYAVCMIDMSMVNMTNATNVTNASYVTPAEAVTLVGKLTVTSRVYLGWTYIFDPNVDGSLEVLGVDLDWKKDRLMVADCSATCGYASAADGAILGGEKSSLQVSNSFIALNEEFDLKADETTNTFEPLPSSLRTYVRRSSSYCRSNNLGENDVGPEIWQDQCHAKCSNCVGPACPAECVGFSPDIDGPASQALCLSEVQCRAVCSSLDVCYGIDMYKYGPRCYLNVEGPAEMGCKAQYEDIRLGVSGAYDFLAKEMAKNVAQQRSLPEAVSTTEVLKFYPVGFAGQGSGAGKFKICFCDHELLPEDQTDCLSEADYSLDVGTLYVSGLSCLLSNPSFRRGTCYPMYWGGLACSEDARMELPALTAMPPSAGLPKSWAAYAL
jgi:hypothetical protein